MINIVKLNKTLILIPIVALVALATFYAYDEIQQSRKNAFCRSALKSLYQVVRKGEGVMDAEELKEKLHAPTSLVCVGCMKQYVYMPFSGAARFAGTRHGTSMPSELRLLMWCPEPCHNGRRNALLEDSTIISLSESDFAAASKNGYKVCQ